MNNENIKNQFIIFIRNYDAAEKDKLWLALSSKFKTMWTDRIVSSPEKEISEEEIDEIISILDVNAKGHTKETEAVAKVMIAQGAWRRMFKELHRNKLLSSTITNIFLKNELHEKSVLIDKLYEINKDKKNNLTGPSGNAINSMLAAFDPFKNSSMISLKDRKSLIDYLGFPWTFSFEEVSIGKKIVETNRMILQGFESLGIIGSARTISEFCYSGNFEPLWKPKLIAKRQGGDVEVTIPIEHEVEKANIPKDEERESIRIQALLADMGSQMGMKIWVPKSDRSRILKYWKNSKGNLLDVLPLNYNDSTLKTIEQIDVLWLHGMSIVRAFEIEHTTAIYSGILRMADLLALQPNMSIKLHIVAPSSKREKVFQEIRRPVFSLLERGPLAETCTFISYDNLRDLSGQKKLAFLKDEVLDTYAEKAE